MDNQYFKQPDPLEPRHPSSRQPDHPAEPGLAVEEAAPTVYAEAVPAPESEAWQPPVALQVEEVQEPAGISEAPAAAEAPIAPKSSKKEGRGKVWRSVGAAVLVLVLIAGGCLGTAALLNSRYDAREAAMQAQLDQLSQKLEEQSDRNTVHINTVTPATGTSGQITATGDAMTPAQVYAGNVDSVVLVYNKMGNGTSSGTGFVLSSNGYVVTNHHVIEGGGKLTVTTTDGTEHPATLVGSDNANDVALLKVEAEGLQAVVLGDSDALTVGDQVVAIGNPLGELTSTLTVGYVSAKERDVNTSGFAINMIQTDAAINSGNSGGPLFNMQGHVVGITTAKYSGSSSSGATIEGIGFAIPINDVRSLLEDLAANGRATGPYLGVSVSDMDAEAANYYGMPVGVYVNEVTPGYCAEKAGMLAKDIILKVGDHEVDSVNDLSRALRNYKPGQTVQVTVFRSGSEKVLTVTLDEKPEDLQQPSQQQTQEPSEGSGGNRYDFLFPDRG